MVLKRIVWKTLGICRYVIQCGCIAHCTLEYVADFVFCFGPSMQPTILSKDVVFTEHLSTRFQWIQKGDIVIAKSPTNHEEFVCKRVIAMAGDEVCRDPTAWRKSYEYVPLGHVWLEGDNTVNSTDSRKYGPVPYALLRGKVFFKIWPLNDLGFLKSCPQDISKKIR
ncbi:mitochondrial inner membrane protease subunit 1-like [Saccoglossus kowalevskii]|uniref:Mitochondrial inner membrane protease subunit n=1 Tax=Saccoglossus kowalevskii TaxID=10224 RepID=A0ABM0MEL5_SACKO|nr:PREDICTED: mitochondrial inner membrane protease subunit 1-like [Saccoglossus kowalevskii]